MSKTLLAELSTPAGATLWRLSAAQPPEPAAPGTQSPPDITICDTAPAQGFPARLLPGTAKIGPLTQTTPHGFLPAYLRLLIAGALAHDPNWDGIVVVLRNNSAHWTHVSAAEAISTTATLTPQLAQTLNANGPPDTETLCASLSRPETLATCLYRAEPGQILGALLGAELAATRRWWLGQQIILVGDSALADAYGAALTTQATPHTTTGTDTALRQGLSALQTSLF